MVRFDIIIAGASFAGLALARALALAVPGLRVAVADRVPKTGGPRVAESRAVTISASSRALLDVLGVWPLLTGDAQPVTRIEITDSSLDAGVRPVLLAYDNRVEGGEPAAWVAPAASLLSALREMAEASGGVSLIDARGRALAANESELRLDLDDGETLRAALLVAADGRRSALREAAGIKCVSWDTGQIGIVVTISHERPHNGVAVQHFLPGGPFALLPLKGDRCCVTWSEEAGEARRILALDGAAFGAEVEKRCGGKLGAIVVDGPRQSWPLEQSLARGYSALRFALAGDAAHAVHPVGGQGLNLALRDAAALAEVLAEAARLGLDLGSATALDRYARWRRFDSSASAFGFAGLERLFSNDSMLKRAARDFGLRIVDGLPGVKSMLVREAAGLTGDVPKLMRGEMA